MWQELSIDQSSLLRRAVEIMLDCAPLGEMLSVDRVLASERSGVMSGAGSLFYYPGQGFELIAKTVYQPKSDRFQVYYAVAGDVDAKHALDLIIEQTHRFMLLHGIKYVYGCRPKQQRSALLREISDLASVDDRVEETVLADRPSMWVYRLAYRPAVQK
jgi:hypothetical protein